MHMIVTIYFDPHLLYIYLYLYIDIAPALDNYLTFGGEIFGNTETYQAIIFDFIKTGLISSETNEEQRCDAVQLIEPFLLTYRGRMDRYVTEFLNLAISALQSAGGRRLRLICIEVALVCIYYDAKLTIDYFEAHGFTEALFEFWFSNIALFKRVHDKKLCVLTILTLLEYPLSQLPTSIQKHLKHAIDTMIKIFDELPEAYKKREEEEAKLDEFDEASDKKFDSETEENDKEYEDFEDANLEGVYSDDFDWKKDDNDITSDSEIFEQFGYETPVDHTDEYKVFETIFSRLPHVNPELYHAIVNGLDTKQQQSLHTTLQKAKHIGSNH